MGKSDHLCREEPPSLLTADDSQDGQPRWTAKMDTGVRFGGGGLPGMCHRTAQVWAPSHKGQPQSTHLIRDGPHPTLEHFIPLVREGNKTRDLAQEPEAGSSSA